MLHDNDIQVKIATEIKEQISALIDEKMQEIMQDYEDKMVADSESESDRTSKFRIAFGSVLSPYGNGMSVSSKINWSVRKSTETEAKTVGYSEEPLDEI